MSIISQIAFIAAFAIVFLFLWLFLLRWRVTRAQMQVVRAFRHHGALSPSTAKTLEEMRVGRQQMIGLRNFQALAVRSMMTAGIVVPVEGGRFYLSEEAIQAAMAAAQKGR